VTARAGADGSAGIDEAIAALGAGRAARAERIARGLLRKHPGDVRARALLTLLFPDEAAPSPQPDAPPADAPPIEDHAPPDPVQIADALRRSSRQRARSFLAAHLAQHADDIAASCSAQALAAEADDFAFASALSDGVAGGADKTWKFAANLLRLGLAQQAEIQGDLDDDLPNLWLVALARFEDMQPVATRVAVETMARLDPTSAWTRLGRALVAIQAGDLQDAGFHLAQAAVAADHAASHGTAPPSLSCFVALLAGWFGSDEPPARAERMRTALAGLPQLARWRARLRRLVPEPIPDWQVAWVLHDRHVASIAACFAQCIEPGQAVLDILPGSGLSALFAARAGARVFVLLGHPAQAAALRGFFAANLAPADVARVQLLQAGPQPLDRGVLGTDTVDWIIAEPALPCVFHARLLESAAYWHGALGSPATRFLPDAIELEIACVEGARRPRASCTTPLGTIRLGRLGWSGATLRAVERVAAPLHPPRQLTMRLGTPLPGHVLPLGAVGTATHVQVAQHLRYGEGRIEGAVLQLAFEPQADAPDRDPAPPDPQAQASLLLLPDDLIAFAAPPAPVATPAEDTA
jgi:hypothetical protein